MSTVTNYMFFSLPLEPFAQVYQPPHLVYLCKRLERGYENHLFAEMSIITCYMFFNTPLEPFAQLPQPPHLSGFPYLPFLSHVALVIAELF